ncbi:MAG: hypothetical protein RIQ94_2907, partial [Pseudomonadota bacterium]
MTEEDFWKDFELIKKEIDIAIYSYYTWIEINNYVAINKKILNSMNKTPMFWKANLYGLQVSYFMVLGRIFDDGKDCHSIHKFINSCIDNIEYFSYNALEKRKLSNSEKPDWLDEYMSKAYQPKNQDFYKVKEEIKCHRKKFDDVYKNIRNDVFGHNTANKTGNTNNLFGKTKFGDLEEMLYFLYDLQENIWELFHN